MRVLHRNFHGFRIAGLTLLQSNWRPDGRTVILASYHHPKRVCWLWFLEARLRRGILPRLSRIPGAQAQTYISLPFIEFVFFWQEQGRFTDASNERVRSLLGVKDWK